MTTVSVPPSVKRIYSIDVFRAITMLMMIFVNDLWTLKDIPDWLGHVEAHEDGMGLADVVFPAFLVIVGLSIPFAISKRIQKGESISDTLKHIFFRTLALLIMGVFHVNLENYNRADSVLSKPLWQILMTIAFFLIWLDYSSYLNKKRNTILQVIGILTLGILAYFYVGGTPENPTWMKFHWWGILGLIGWAYLIASLVYLAFREMMTVYILFFLFFLFFNSAEKLGWLDFLNPIKPYFWISGNGSNPAFSMAGVVIGLYYKNYFLKGKHKNYGLVLGSSAMILILFGLLTRPLWGIHKIGASPSWVTTCTGLSFLVLAVLIWLADKKGKAHWFYIIKPAGTSTLTCYLLPYIHYALFSMVGIVLPLFLRTGVIGIIKSLFYAFIIILITGLLEKQKIRLKI
jgi:predicted acyltransferase